jgi:hypothetical protein
MASSNIDGSSSSSSSKKEMFQERQKQDEGVFIATIVTTNIQYLFNLNELELGAR